MFIIRDWKYGIMGEVESQKSKVESRRSKVEGQRSKVEGQKLKVKGDEFGRIKLAFNISLIGML